jgi:hypothetical protein
VSRLRRALSSAVIALWLLGHAHAARAQATALPRSRTDALIDAGRWAEAEDVLYADVKARPRDPEARARLGHYLAMKGALRPGLVLIDEAVQFGLASEMARAIAAPIRALIQWRDRELAAAHDASIEIRAPSGEDAILQFPVVRASGDTLWADLVPRAVGLDSAATSQPRVGIETIEALVPECDVANRMLRLHADPRAALGAPGRRYAVLRTARDVRVLLAPGRVASLPRALRELAPRWWQLDLPHGVLIVR